MRKAHELPIVRFYIQEARKVYDSGLYLSCILLCGVLAELIARELETEKSKRTFHGVLRELLRAKIITRDEYVKLDSIRKIRNRYVHLDLGSEYESSFHGLAFEDRNGIVTLFREIVDDADYPETALLKLHEVSAEFDAKEILSNLEGLVGNLKIDYS